jgi:uncharacterized RDD family membrane protein YckC
MDEILDAPVNRETKLNYAGFWIRFGAYIIDAIILWIVQFILGTVLFNDYNYLEGNLILSMISILIAIGYFSGMESSTKQGTLGKILLGLKVGDVQGNQITFGNALGRYLAKFLSAIILMIGFMMAGWDDKKQALHDKLAGTYVYES